MTGHYPDPVQYAIPAFVLGMMLEMFAIRAGATGDYDWRDTAASLAMGLGNTVTSAIFGGTIVAVGFWLYQYRLFDIPHAWWALALAFICEDFFYYWFHRTAHRVRWFWASHVIHHSSQHYNLSTALRQTWTGFFSASFAFRLPLFLIGFPPDMVLFCAGLNLVYQFWIHTELVRRLPLGLEAVLNTPSHHRVHHGTNPRYLDRNYAGVFIVWDKMFGTYEAEDDAERPRYGIVKNLPTFNPLWVAAHEWVGIARDLGTARTWRERWQAVAGPPGASSGETADAIRAHWQAQRAAQPAPAE